MGHTLGHVLAQEVNRCLFIELEFDDDPHHLRNRTTRIPTKRRTTGEVLWQRLAPDGQ
ncbi:hypothetical protein RvY_04598 [Ramazzottius varieornatus]|uniref:Uncharacterized protein n=1 Tax=Ramazzottius varieornatus TaxID=947166 RepID=A0A1D1UYU5_RAMVA|nr:hypothetical protein RvY_04598 [Ramazzottius varieornatus]